MASTERPTTIASLPWEILSNILNLAADANIAEGYTQNYTYGLSQVSRTLQLHHKLQVQKHLTGRIPTDILQWRASDSIRRTCSRWHEWALGYSLKELYVRRWRGGESWDPKFLALPSPSGGPLTAEIFPVVYQDPYRTLKSTTALFESFPHIALHVRRLWFTGIYQYTNVSFIYRIIKNCYNVRSITVPWSSLRYGTVDEWVHITNNLTRLTSLEFLGMDLKKSQIAGDKNIDVNYRALEDTRVNFSKLRRLKIHGSSNVQSIEDGDLWEIARTATSLKELHITGMSTLTIAGVTALMSASHKSLKLINYVPLDPTTAGYTHLNPSPGPPNVHFCDVLTSCSNLVDVNVTVPHICENLLSPPPCYAEDAMEIDHQNLRPVPKWRGSAIIRLSAGGRTCVHPELPLEHPDSRLQLQGVLAGCRFFERTTAGANIELVIGNYSFHPASHSVAGNFRGVKKLSEGTWQPEGEQDSTKGPWGSTGIWGETGNRGWTEIGEEDFCDGVRSGLIRFDC